jgi:4-hydroxy-3-polyprenylbenzoate decarboxylase
VAENRWIVAITGASGTVYARRLLRVLIERVDDIRLEVIVSPAGLRVLRDEEGLAVSPSRLTAELLLGIPTDAVSVYCDQPPGRITMHDDRNLGASLASGSYPARGMVIVPCSMKTLAAVAHGYAENLIARAADVALKERRRLILVPRETPLSAIHLQNMLRLARLGVAIVPAMPGFYHRPASIDDLVEMMVMRILDQMGLQIDLVKRWSGSSPSHGLPSASQDSLRRSDPR